MSAGAAAGLAGGGFSAAAFGVSASGGLAGFGVGTMADSSHACDLWVKSGTLVVPQFMHTSIPAVGGRVQMNSLKVFLLLAALTGLFLAVGALIGGGQGMVIAFI